jgi:DNA-binding response OmpR family regulator
MNILLVEDEEKVARFIQRGLSECDHRVTVAPDGESGLRLAMAGNFDILILDWMLPGKSGLEVCQALRRDGVSLPVLMLTARDSVRDRVEGLDCGADDYLTKPFAFEELKARIRALSRRVVPAPATLSIDDLQLHLLDRRVTRAGETLHLSAREFDLLLFFMKNQNQVITRETLATAVWGIDFDTGTNYIDVYVNYLRNKLKAGSQRPLIFTLRGIGYIMKVTDAPEH